MSVFVELLCDVAEGGRDLAKACAAADAFGLGKSNALYPRLKVTVSRRGRIEYVKGLVVEMTLDGAAKWVERGIGKIVDKPKPKMVLVVTKGRMIDDEFHIDAAGKSTKVVEMDADSAAKLVAMKAGTIKET